MKTAEPTYSLLKNLDVVFLLLSGVVVTFAIEKLNAPLIAILFAAQLFVLIKNKKANLKITWYFWCLMALFSLNLLGLLYTENLPKGFEMIGRQISFLLFPLFYGVYQIKNIALLFRVYCVSIFVLIFLFELDTVYRFLYKSDTFPLSLDLFLSYRYTGAELTKLLGVHNAYFGMYILFSNTLILNQLRQVKSTRIFALLFLLICVQSLFLLQMVAKTAIISNSILVVGSIIYILIKQKKLKLLFFVATLIALFAYFSSSYLKLPLERITERFEELNQGKKAERETRIKLWNAALPIIENNPIIGVGTGDVQDHLHAVYKKNNITSKSNIHNQYLDYLMRYGIIGLFIFLYVLGYALIHAYKTSNFIYFCFTLIVMGCCFTENILSRQWGITFYTCFNYLLYLNAKKD
ncbi:MULTISPECIES: O-antigen ligase family protein [Arenibacter]|uniref:O-antigen ligase family protein n=1 Tax=Arenibacter TaxID=178469 RepID=UPI0004DEDA75|nr:MULTISPECIES: O-antigen ligase family protein [Arenibacter]GBF18517.1 O-Antigen ligase [Arenibacter sp. NBRC 103722]